MTENEIEEKERREIKIKRNAFMAGAVVFSLCYSALMMVPGFAWWVCVLITLAAFFALYCIGRFDYRKKTIGGT